MFFRILGNKNLREKGEDLINQHGKKVQIAGAKLYDAVEALSKQEWEKVKSLSKEIDKLEQDADEIKDELAEEIFAKGSYLPHDTELRHNLISRTDKVINQIDLTAEKMVLKQYTKKEIPKILTDMAKRSWECTDLLQDAIKFLWTDYREARKVVRELEEARSEAKDLYYSFLETCFAADTVSGDLLYLKEVAASLLDVIIFAERVGDYIKALTFKFA
ncbi:MAG: DUF47 domain-containing protein [Candidatus Odinarchaeota archaeon]